MTTPRRRNHAKWCCSESFLRLRRSRCLETIVSGALTSKFLGGWQPVRSAQRGPPLFLIANYSTIAGGHCVINVRMYADELSSHTRLMTSWYEIWEQAVALTVLCARKGKGGSANMYSKQVLLHLEDWKLGADHDYRPRWWDASNGH